MRVDVDEARRDDRSGRIDFSAPGLIHGTYRRDAIPFDGQVAGERLRSGAVDDATATNDEIELLSHLETSPRDESRMRQKRYCKCTHRTIPSGYSLHD